MNWIALSGQQSVQKTNISLATHDRDLTATNFHERYLSRVLRHVSCRIDSREDAEDITVEVFAAAFQSLSRLKRQSDAYHWLLGIARRKIADHLRKRGRSPATVTPDAEDRHQTVPGPDCDVEREEAAGRIREIVRGLRDDQREALLLKYIDDLSINEIAEVMRKTPAGVNSLLQRARANVYRAGQEYFQGIEVSK